MEKKLRPVGSTSGRPRVGAPEAPDGTKRPSSARSIASASRGPQTSRRSRMGSRACDRTSADRIPGAGSAPDTSASASRSSRSTVSPQLRQGASLMRARISGRGPSHGNPRSAVSGSKSSREPRPRSLASARGSDSLAPSPSPRGVRRICARSPSAASFAGDRPNTCRPSRI